MLGGRALARAPCVAQPVVYRRREPEKTALYRVVLENLRTFEALADQTDRPVPRFVVREMERYLDCGILQRGFARVHCQDCGYDRLVAFSCKGRGICPSCVGRQMNETAAHLSDNVIGSVPVRHWVLTLPPPLRYLLAYDPGLCTEVLRAFIDSMFSWLRTKAKKEFGLPSVRDAHPGSVTVVHRCSGHLALNIHFHTLATDGVFVKTATDAAPVFRALPPPTRGDMLAVAWNTCVRTTRMLRKRGLWLDVDPDDDKLARDEPLLAQCCSTSMQGVLMLGPRAGRRVIRLVAQASGLDDDQQQPEVSTPGFGFNVYARTRVCAGDKKGLERMARYLTRPPIAQKRLKKLGNGSIELMLKRPWKDGTSSFIFDPLDFMAKLTVLVPPPRMHRTRFHGVWAPNAKLRSSVVPRVEVEESSCDGDQAKHDRRRYGWAKLMARVY